MPIYSVDLTSYANLQAAVTAASAVEKAIDIPAGVNTTPGATHSSGAVALQGAISGSQGSELQLTASNTAILTATAPNVSVEDVRLTGKSDWTLPGQVGLNFDGVNQWRIDGAVFGNLANCVKTNGTTFYGVIESCKFFDGPGSMLNLVGSSDAGMALELINNEFLAGQNGAGSTIDITNIGSIVATGNVINLAKAEHSLHIRSSASAAGVSQWTANVFEAAGKDGIFLEGTSNRPIRDQFFVNCYSQSNGAYPALGMKYVSDVQWVGGYMAGTSYLIEVKPSGAARDVSLNTVRYEMLSTVPLIKVGAGATLKGLKVVNNTHPGGVPFLDATATTAANLQQIYIDPATVVGSNSQPIRMPSGGYAPEILDWHHRNKCKARKSSFQSLSASVSTKVLFDVELYDKGRYNPATETNQGIFDTVTSTISPLPGVNVFNARGYVLGMTAGSQVWFELWKDGALLEHGPSFIAAAAGDCSISATWEDACDGSNVYELHVRPSAGSGISLVPGEWTTFACHQA